MSDVRTFDCMKAQKTGIIVSTLPANTLSGSSCSTVDNFVF